MPLAIKFWAKPDAASCAASSPPAIKARLTVCTPSATTASGRRPKIRNGANTSNAPGIIPAAVALARSSSVAPSASARVRASPAPAPTPRPIAPTRPAAPRGPASKKGRVEPTASDPLRITESSYPGAASNGLRAAEARLSIPPRTDRSIPSGKAAAIPVPADSKRLTAPAGSPLSASRA